MSKSSSERKSRSLLKAISWRLIAFIILGMISYLFTGSWKETGLITIVYNVLQIGVYFLHERLWDSVRWGKRQPVEQLPRAEELTLEEVNQITQHLRQLGYVD